jgi:filamentous hemagglutinin
VIITNEIGQQQRAAQSVEQTLASLNHDIANANNAAQKQDVQAMERTAEAERAIKQEAVKQVVVHTDAAYKAMFKTDAKLYKVTCSSTSENCLNDPKLVLKEGITLAEAKTGGKVLAVNGIMNDAPRAAQLAYQNAPEDKTTGQKPASITLMHIPSADTGFGDVFVAGYEKLLAPIFGYTNADLAYADLLQGRGDEVILSLGHSRGAIVQRNAFNIAADNGYVNKNLEVVGVGGGVGFQEYTDAAARVIQNKQRAKENVTYTYMANDPVSVIAAFNPGDFWGAFKEFYNVYATSNSAHSCYGSGSFGCSTIANPVPGGPVPTNQNSGLIRVYRGGELVSPQPIVSGGQP